MSPSAPSDLTLAVGIPTFRRAERLAKLLPIVAEHVRSAQESGLVSSGRIIVVDNDSALSARSVVEEFASDVPVAYVSQTIPGIPAVRNAALDEARDVRLLAFIDDDETPRDGWLAHLVTTWRDHGRPTGVSGLVVSHFPDDVDPWILASGVFRRPERPTGTRMGVVATGNLLLDLDAVRSFGTRFDESIGLGGGSDTKFSTELSREGATFVWCNESVADDPVEASRLSREWVLRRAYSHGNVAVRVHVAEGRTAGRRMQRRVRGVAGGAGRAIVGAGWATWGRVSRSLRWTARGDRMMRRGAGMITGAYGRAFHAYAHDRAAAEIASRGGSTTVNGGANG